MIFKKIRELIDMRDNIYLLLGTALLILSGAYLLLRAQFISITHDEAITYLRFATRPYLGIIAGNPSSNNHFLNTILIKFFTNVFGLSEFVVRCPALIGASMYLFSSYFLSKLLFKKSPLFFISIILLISSPLVMDFLPLARGYSLALGFFMVAVYYLLKKEHHEIVILMTTLSVFSNLSFLYTYVAFLTILVFGEIRNPKILIRKVIVPAGVSVLFLITTIGIQIIKMQEANEFFFGLNSNFWQDTVTSIIVYNLYGNPYLNVELFQLIVISIIVLSIFIVCINKNDESLKTILSLIIIIITLINIHHLLGGLFIVTRAAIFFVPLFALVITLTWRDIISVLPQYYRLICVIFTILVFIFCLNFMLSINLTHTKEWQYDSDVNKVINKIKIDQGNSSTKKSIGITWLHEPSINFLRVKDSLTWLNPVTINGPDGIYDYYIVQNSYREIINRFNLTYENYPMSNITYAKWTVE